LPHLIKNTLKISTAVVYVISVMMVTFSKETWFQKYLGQNYATWIASNTVAVLLFCVAARAIFYTQKLQTKAESPHGHKVLWTIIATSTAMILLAAFIPTANIWMWAEALAALSLLGPIAIAYQSVHRGSTEGRSYLVGSIIFTVFAGISGAAELGFLPYSKLVHLSLFLGTSLEMISIGMCQTHKHRASEATAAQQKARAVQISEQLAVQKAKAHEREISAEFNESIISKLPVPLVLLGNDLRVIRVNERFVLQFGHDEKKLQKLFTECETFHITQASSPLSDEMLDKPLDPTRAFRQQNPELFAFITASLDSFDAPTNFLLQSMFYGENRVFQVNCQRIVSPRDNKPQLLLAVEDLTAVYELNYSMQLAAESARQHSTSKSNFLANMSHEIRTPLAVIVGYAGLLENESQNSPQKKSYLSKIMKSSHHLLALVDEVLDLSKIEAGKIEIDALCCNFLEEFSDTMAMLSSRAKENGLKFNIEFLGKIPHKITTNPLRLRQILINVIGNAAKFTEHGGVQVKVSMTSTKRLTFEVTDTGCGMTALQQQRLFQPFVQADASISRKYGGTGLGLALSRLLAQAMGGNIELAWSKINVGSCFIVEIDPGEISDLREVNYAAWESGYSTLALSDSSAPQMPNVHILLVEDSPELRELLTIYLEATGAQIDVAVNGADAISRCMSKSYDVILMDIQMPILDGYQATEKLLSLGFTTPIIALTAHALTTERDICFAKGFSDYLSKPVTSQDLFAALDRHTSIAANSRN
jgi:signal transduction histidine kinase/ActR/RegA family two-component response regulator